MRKLLEEGAGKNTHFEQLRRKIAVLYIHSKSGGWITLARDFHPELKSLAQIQASKQIARTDLMKPAAVKICVLTSNFCSPFLVHT